VVKTGATVEVNVMDLFASIDRKLDTMGMQISLKANVDAMSQLTVKVTELEVHGSNNAQAAAAGVMELQKKIGDMGWKIVGAMATAILSVIATLVVALVKLHN
jgi:hypothetical protein